jgi:hypothetical protein
MKAKYYRRGQGETGTTCVTMNANEGTVLREAWSDGARSNSALCERGERGGPERVPRDRDGDEGRTANDMKTILLHQGSGGTRRRYGVETSACSGGESTRLADRGRCGNE